MPVEPIDLYISVNTTSNIDKEGLDELAQELSRDLRELDSVQSVEPVRVSKTPERAKGPSIDIGTILIKIAEFGGLSAFVTVLATWLTRDKSRTLKLQLGENVIELTGLSKSEQAELVQWFRTQTGLRLDS